MRELLLTNGLHGLLRTGAARVRLVMASTTRAFQFSAQPHQPFFTFSRRAPPIASIAQYKYEVQSTYRTVRVKTRTILLYPQFIILYKIIREFLQRFAVAVCCSSLLYQYSKPGKITANCCIPTADLLQQFAVSFSQFAVSFGKKISGYESLSPFLVKGRDSKKNVEVSVAFCCSKLLQQTATAKCHFFGATETH